MREGENTAQTSISLSFSLTKLECLWNKILEHNSDGCKYWNMLLGVSESSIGNF